MKPSYKKFRTVAHMDRGLVICRQKCSKFLMIEMRITRKGFRAALLCYDEVIMSKKL